MDVERLILRRPYLNLIESKELEQEIARTLPVVVLATQEVIPDTQDQIPLGAATLLMSSRMFF